MGNTLTVEEIDNYEWDFQSELRTLRDKYPHFYIEVWGPYDFAMQLKNGNEYKTTEELVQVAADKWNQWEGVVEILQDTFDAHVGTNWDRLTQAVEEIERDAK